MSDRLFPVIPDEPFRHATRLGLRFTLQLDEKSGIDELLRIFHGLKSNSRPNCRSGSKGRRETDLIQAVIDSHLYAGTDSNYLAEDVAKQRKAQKAVSDTAAERRLAARAVRVDVNPLPVFGRVGKSLDAILRDGKPVGRGKFASFTGFQ